MQFNSIKEYFYKLYNLCYVLSLIPLGSFIYLYLEVQAGKLQSPLRESVYILYIQIAFVAAAVLILTTVQWQSKSKLRSIRPEVSLGDRMDRYYSLSLFRFGGGVVASLVLAAAFYLTASEWFSVAFLLILVWMSFQWPSPRKLCSDLMLKGDEKDIILYKRDQIR